MVHVFRTDWGWLSLRSTSQGLSRASLPHGSREKALAAVQAGEEDVAAPNGLLRRAESQLRAYFAGAREALDVPLDLSSTTPFQRRVLRVVAGVPFGSTASYGEIAARAGSPGAARAIGQVMARNPLALFVPCHRIVAADGSLGGFGGGLALKRALLEHEQRGRSGPRGRPLA